MIATLDTVASTPLNARMFQKDGVSIATSQSDRFEVSLDPTPSFLAPPRFFVVTGQKHSFRLNRWTAQVLEFEDVLFWKNSAVPLVLGKPVDEEEELRTLPALLLHVMFRAK